MLHSLSQALRDHLPSLPPGQRDRVVASPTARAQPHEAAPTPGSTPGPLPCPAPLPPLPVRTHTLPPKGQPPLQLLCIRNKLQSHQQGKRKGRPSRPPAPAPLPRRPKAWQSPSLARGGQGCSRSSPGVLGGIGGGTGHVSVPGLRGQANQLECGGTRTVQWF